MGHTVIRDARIWVAQYDFSGHASECVLDYSAEAPDDTPLNATTRSRLAGGLRDIALSLAGYWEAAATGAGRPDNALEANLALADIPVSVCYVPAAAEGSRAFTFRALEAQYSQGGRVGDAHKFNARAMASQGPLVRGSVMHNASRTATGNAGGQQLGALGATDYLFAALHVFSASGTSPTLDVIVQSDDNSGFTTPTTQITFTQAIGAGTGWSQFLSAAGAVTDDYWRVRYTIGGSSTPTFNFAVVAGIASAAS